MKAVIGSIKRFWIRYKEENPTIQVSVPIVGGFSANIPLSEKGKIKPTRKGTDSKDKKTPFIESDTSKLLQFYTKYESEKEYKFCRAPYAETVPLRKGNKGFSYGKDVEELEVVFVDAKFVPPDSLLEHSEKAVDLFKDIGKVRFDEESGEWQNDCSVRVAKLDLEENKIHIQLATYFDQVGTNLSLDWASGVLGDDDNLTIRNDLEKHSDGRLTPLRSSVLANTLGVAVVVINPETKEVLIPIRGSEQAIMHEGEGKFHCSASGVFAWRESDFDKNNLSFDFFSRGMEKEIESEIGLQPDQYELIPVAFSRELPRGGKPQLFYIAETSMDIKDIQSGMKYADESWEFINQEDIVGENPLYEYISSPSNAPQEMFTYEGWMSIKIAMAYFYSTEPPFSVC